MKTHDEAGPLPDDFEAKRRAAAEVRAIEEQVGRDLRGVRDMLALWRAERAHCEPVVEVGGRRYR